MAAHLRRRLDAEIGPEYGPLLDLVIRVRDEWHVSGRSTEGADWRAALDSGILDLIRAGRLSEAEELLRSCL